MDMAGTILIVGVCLHSSEVCCQFAPATCTALQAIAAQAQVLVCLTMPLLCILHATGS